MVCEIVKGDDDGIERDDMPKFQYKNTSDCNNKSHDSKYCDSTANTGSKKTRQQHEDAFRVNCLGVRT